MKRIHGWTLLGVAGVSLAATLVGQSVWGQLDEKRSAGTLPIVDSRPELPPLPTETVSVQEDARVPQSRGGSPPVVNSIPRAGSDDGSVQIVNSPAPIAPPSPSFPKTAAADSTAVPAPKVEKDAFRAASADPRSGRQQPSVSLEWVGPATARIQQSMPCQLLVRNTSNAPVQNIVVRQRLSPGVVCKLSEPQAVHEAGELVWNLGTLAPEQSRRIDVHLVAQARGEVNCVATVSFTGSATHQVQIREPQLAVKMRSPDKVVSGDSVTLLFAVSNPGDGMAEMVRVKAMLPEGLEHSRGRVVEVEVGNLAPKEIRTMQLVCLAKGTGVQKCMFAATAEGGINSVDSTQIEILTPKLIVEMVGPKLRYLDRHAVYVVKILNPGSAPATNVEVQNIVPAGFRFHQANQGGQYHAATKTVSWVLGDLQPGQTREIAMDVIPVEAGEFRVATQAKTSRGLKSEAEARTIVEGLPALEIELNDTEDPIEVGADTAYELHVTNKGTKTETNVIVVCTLPSQIEFRSAKCSTPLRYRIEGRELIFEPLPRLAPKADVIYRIQVKGIAAGDVRFRTSIRADDLREPIIREERTRIYSDDSPLRSSPTPTPNANQPSATSPAAPPAKPLPVPNPAKHLPAPKTGAETNDLLAPNPGSISLPNTMSEFGPVTKTNSQSSVAPASDSKVAPKLVPASYPVIITNDDSEKNIGPASKAIPARKLDPMPNSESMLPPGDLPNLRAVTPIDPQPAEPFPMTNGTIALPPLPVQNELPVPAPSAPAPLPPSPAPNP